MSPVSLLLTRLTTLSFVVADHRLLDRGLWIFRVSVYCSRRPHRTKRDSSRNRSILSLNDVFSGTIYISERHQKV